MTIHSQPLHSTTPQLPARILRFILGDVFLGFLAIVAAALTFVPMLFALTGGTNALLELVQWLIIGLFAVEYCSSLAVARSKKKFLLNPWRLVDAATVILPLLTLIPGASRLFRSSAALRLVRLARVVALGARVSGVMAREERTAASVFSQDPLEVHLFTGGAAAAPRRVTWEEFIHWARRRGEEWFSLANVGAHNVAEVAKATGISREFITNHLLGTSYPHIQADDQYLSMFVWLPARDKAGAVERNGLLLLANDKTVVTFCRRPAHLIEKVAAEQPADLNTLPFPVRIICQLLTAVLDANEHLIGAFEDELRALEDIPVRESRPQFFERTFRLKKELSATQSDLWRLRGVLKALSESRIKLPANGVVETPYLRDLAEEADYLYETVNNIRDGVLSLIDLHLNVVSFEMNRVMRVLAVVSVLGLIPAVVGGLLGMNLAGNPWPFTLAQVSFLVCTGMITSLYFFVVKGWLR